MQLFLSAVIQAISQAKGHIMTIEDQSMNKFNPSQK